MTDDTHDLHANLPEKEKEATIPAPSSQKQASLSGSFAQRIVTRMIKSTPKSRWPIVIGAFILLLIAMLPGIYSLGLLFRPSATPVLLTMVTSYNKNSSQGLEARRGAQLSIDEANQNGGVNGHKIVLNVLNDGGVNTKEDAKIANQATTSSSLLLLGPIYSSMVFPTSNPAPDISKIYSDSHIPLITASISSDALTHTNLHSVV
jgi:ABC-type branched-subunit amino acid transport system substrate-binding protein